jgi:hypothetical protein
MLQDRLDRTVAGVADVIAAPAGGFESCRAVAPGQPQNTEAGAEALLGMRLGLHFQERDRGEADLAGGPRPVFPHGRRHLAGRPTNAHLCDLFRWIVAGIAGIAVWGSRERAKARNVLGVS